MTEVESAMTKKKKKKKPVSYVKLMLTPIKECIVTMQLASTKTPLLMDANRKFSLPSTKTPIFVDGNRKLIWN